MAADSVNEIVSGSRFATIDCTVVEGLSVGAVPLRESLVAWASGQRRGVLGRLCGRRPRTMSWTQLPTSDLARSPEHLLLENFRRSAVCFSANVGSGPWRPTLSHEWAPSGLPAMRVGAPSTLEQIHADRNLFPIPFGNRM